MKVTHEPKINEATTGVKGIKEITLSHHSQYILTFTHFHFYAFGKVSIGKDAEERKSRIKESVAAPGVKRIKVITYSQHSQHILPFTLSHLCSYSQSLQAFA